MVAGSDSNGFECGHHHNIASEVNSPTSTLVSNVVTSIQAALQLHLYAASASATHMNWLLVLRMQQVTLSSTTLPLISYETGSVRGILSQAQAWDQLACTRGCVYGVTHPVLKTTAGGIQ